MDILTDAVASVRTGNPVSARTDCRAPWGLRFAEQAGAGFHVVLAGTCWLIEPGGATTRLGPGDIVFVRSGREHVLADDPGSPVVDYRADLSWPRPPTPSPADPGTGPVSTILCGSYLLDQERPHPLVATLPPLIHLPARRGRHTALASAVDLLAAELERPGPGSDGIVAQLIDLLLLYILRAWLDEQPDAAAAGWAAALRDPAIAPALKAIHADPGGTWTVESLGAGVGLSRAAFARRFTALVGEPPLAYLTRWRMTTAASLLRHSDTPIAVVGDRVGYRSEFAFAKAFKRAYGQPPGQYRRRAREAA
ncbi:AraC family transcriptional regulator [Kitasatospora arboriphila]